MNTSAIRRERIAIGNLILLTALAMLMAMLWIWHARELIWTWPGGVPTPPAFRASARPHKHPIRASGSEVPMTFIVRQKS